MQHKCRYAEKDYHFNEIWVCCNPRSSQYQACCPAMADCRYGEVRKEEEYEYTLPSVENRAMK